MQFCSAIYLSGGSWFRAHICAQSMTRYFWVLLLTSASISFIGLLIIQFLILSSSYASYLSMLFVPGYWTAAVLVGDGTRVVFWILFLIVQFLYAAMLIRILNMGKIKEIASKPG